MSLFFSTSIHQCIKVGQHQNSHFSLQADEYKEENKMNSGTWVTDEKKFQQRK